MLEEIPSLIEYETKTEIFDKAIDKARNGMVFVEVGAFRGGSVCYIGQKIREKNIFVHLNVIDNFMFDGISTLDLSPIMYHRDKNNMFYGAYTTNIEKCNLKVNTIIGDSVVQSNKFRDNTIDFLFLDGCHTYPYVEEELKAWLPKMKKNSMISGHDYSLQSIKTAVKNVLGDDVSITSNNNAYYKELGTGITGNIITHNLIKLIRWSKNESYSMFIR